MIEEEELVLYVCSPGPTSPLCHPSSCGLPCTPCCSQARRHPDARGWRWIRPKRTITHAFPSFLLPAYDDRYKLDTTLLHLPASRVLSLLQTSLTSLRAQTSELETEKEECEEGMKGLKEVLYKKFGGELLSSISRMRTQGKELTVLDSRGTDSINLEK